MKPNLPSRFGSGRARRAARALQAPLLAVAALLLAHCDDEGPPPATAHDLQAVAPGGQPSAAQVEPNATGVESAPGDGTDGEYAIGEESDRYDDTDPASLTDFRETLEPYGTWADDATYGTAWTPSSEAVGPDFQPYVSSGHWLHDDDWVWASDYSWGWAPFHYGRWVFVEGRGWSWIPGRAYRGAWVEWSVDDGYSTVGWAPLPPTFVWFGGFAVPWRGRSLGPRWAYCPRAAVFAPVVAPHVVVGVAALPIASRMKLYTPVGRAALGPPPERLGFAPAQIPRPVGPAAISVARAQQFARPSTAQPLGGRAPVSRGVFGPRPAITGPRPGGPPMVGNRAGGAGPGVRSGSPAPAPVSPGSTGVRPAAPVFSPAGRGSGPSGGAFHSGGGLAPSGGAFHSGGGGHFGGGGGGHHR